MSGRFPSEIVDKIRDSNDIVDVISKYVQLKRVGNRFTGLCPFHAERTPSFSISKDKQLFYCFGCQASGNVFSFIMKMEGLTFSEAVVKLGLQVGIDPTEHYEDDQERAQREHRELLIRVNNFAQKFYHKILIDAKEAEEARNYLHDRKINEEDISKFGLGYSPPDWTALADAANKKGISIDLLLELSLVLKNDGNQGVRDRFRSRVIFPIYNIYNNVIGFGGRIMENIQPKYLNSNENYLFSKRYNLYGLNLALQSIRSKGYVVLVEGYFDVISAHKAGVTNAVASLGTALMQEQCKLISRYCKKAVLCYDGDSAGVTATVKAIDVLNRSGLEVRVAQLDSESDPDSFVKENGAEAFQKLIESSVSDLRFSIEIIFSRSKLNSIEERVGALKELIPILSNIEGQTERLEYIHEISERLSLDVHSITSEVNSTRRRMIRTLTGNNRPVKEELNPIDLNEQHQNSALAEAERDLLRFAAKDLENAKKIVEKFQGIKLSRVEHQKLIEIYDEFCSQSELIEIKSLIDKVDEEYRDYVTQMFTGGIAEASHQNTLEDAVDVWKRLYIVSRLKALDGPIAQAEASDDFDTLKDLLKEQQDLRGQLGKGTIVY